MATEARANLKLGPIEKLCPFAYAEHLGIPVCYPRDLDLPPKHLRQLTITDPDAWSGLTMRIGNETLIVLNSAHPRTRQVNTLMHEIAHVVLKHVPKRVDVSKNGYLLLSDYDEEQEQEADWLSATMLLPRDLLWAGRRRGRTDAEIAAANGVSRELCTWRIRMTGIDMQLRASRARSS